MGNLLKKFNFERNIVRRTTRESAEDAHQNYTAYIAGTVFDPDGVSALKSFMGVITPSEKTSTAVGKRFDELYKQNPEDAWRWLITRSLWLNVFPNGTGAGLNEPARTNGVPFTFFYTLLGLLTHLSSLPGDEAYLYFDEFCIILDDDATWGLSADVLYQKVMNNRTTAISGRQQVLREDLEFDYGLKRDNLVTYFHKACGQTGLFRYKHRRGNAPTAYTGMALDARIDPVLQGRIRFILDTPPPIYQGRPKNLEDWSHYLQNPPSDLPDEVSFAPTVSLADDEADEDITNLIEDVTFSFGEAGLRMDAALIRRFSASLLAKRFVILTGLSGSGKTKLAQAFAQWIAPRVITNRSDAFRVGQILTDDLATFTVATVSNNALQVTDKATGRLITLPLDMVSEVATVADTEGLSDNVEIANILKSKAIFDDNVVDALILPLRAAAFADVAARTESVSSRHYEVIPVGADWIGKENILGYADAITVGRYVRATPAVDLILRAAADPMRPYFLILDEMNLSHVERYFADFLSVIESGEELQFHRAGGDDGKIDGVPEAIRLPDNLFVIGTVNVDETTYLFSPKVLDRANSIEFRVEDEQMMDFLDDPSPADLVVLDGMGRKFARAFAKAARGKIAPSQPARFKAEMALLFPVLAEHGSEFGFRTAKEMSRFIGFHEMLTPTGWEFDAAMDAQICQKVLPKLHGSRRKLEPLLRALAILCWRRHDWDNAVAEANPNDPSVGLTNRVALLEEALKAAKLEQEHLDPLSPNYPESSVSMPTVSVACFPISFHKIKRMLMRAAAEGFTSFAEA